MSALLIACSEYHGMVPIPAPTMPWKLSGNASSQAPLGLLKKKLQGRGPDLSASLSPVRDSGAHAGLSYRIAKSTVSLTTSDS